MDSRRTSRVVDPKVRQVGFFTSCALPLPDRSQSGPPDSSFPTASNIAPSGNSLSPVMIPPPRHASDNLLSPLALHSSSRVVGAPVPTSTLRRPSMDNFPVGSYDPSESLIGTSPVHSPSSNIVNGVFSEDSETWIRRSNSGKFASSLPSGGFDMTGASSVKKSRGVSEKAGGTVVEQANDLPAISKPLKEKMTKSERRALQESQRAAKAAAKGGTSVHEPPVKTLKQSSQKKDGPKVASSISASEKKGGDRPPERERKKEMPPEKDRKKDVPPPRMQFDDRSRVEKAKRRAVVKQTEARNRVELFRHLPQYEHGTRLPDLESKFFQLDPMHPAVYKVGIQYLAADIHGGNARCIAMLQAFQEAIQDYSTPPEKTLSRDLTAKINNFVSFFIACRPLSITMGNAIRFLKARIAKLPATLAESEAKASLCSDIDRFINEKIVVADKVIAGHAVTKIRDGDVVLTYGSSSLVEMILLHAHELGKEFRVVVVDSRPKLEGQALLRRLVGKGDPDGIAKVSGRMDVNYLDNWADKENLQLLNLLYDATPSDYISMIITDYGMVPPTSVPVIVREYGREHLLI